MLEEEVHYLRIPSCEAIRLCGTKIYILMVNTELLTLVIVAMISCPMTEVVKSDHEA